MSGNSKKSFPLRMDPKLYEIIERWAADDLRSVNGHIEYILREAALRAGRLPKARTIHTDQSPSSTTRDDVE